MKRKLLIACLAIAVIVLLSAQVVTYYPSAGYNRMYGGDLSPDWRCDRIELNRLKGIRI